MLYVPIAGPRMSGKSSFILALCHAAREARKLYDPDKPRSVEGWELWFQHGNDNIKLIVLNPPSQKKPFKVTNLLRLLKRYENDVVVFEWEFTLRSWLRISMLYPRAHWLLAHCNTPWTTCSQRIKASEGHRRVVYGVPDGAWKEYHRHNKEFHEAVNNHDLRACEIVHGMTAEAVVNKFLSYVNVGLKLRRSQK